MSLLTLLLKFVATPRRAVVVLLAAVAYCGTGAGDGDGDGDRNSDLIGTWRHTDAYADSISGFSAAVDDVLELSADGSFYEGGRAAAGDAATSFVSDGARAPAGQWKTKDDALLVRPIGESEWFEVGTYGLTDDGSAMLLRYGNGGKKIWNRIGS